MNIKLLGAAVLTWAATFMTALAEEPADSRAAAFQAMEGARHEDVPGGSLLIYAYGFVLCLLVAYLARIGRMQAKTAADLERLSRAVERAGKRA